LTKLKADSAYVDTLVGFSKKVPAVSSPINNALSGLSSGNLNPSAPNTIENSPAAKKQKLNPAPEVQSLASASQSAEIKRELGTLKPAKVSHWAPVGYYYVKAVSFLSTVASNASSNHCNSTFVESPSVEQS
jgi:hypothetical protein